MPRRLLHFRGEIIMSQGTERHPNAEKAVVYTTPGTEAVIVHRDEPYRVADGGTLTMDLYCPPESSPSNRNAAVVFVLGYSDLGAPAVLGCRFKETGGFTSWARLVAASGIVAITYTNRDAVPDLQDLLRHLRQNDARLGIDGDRIGLFAGSGHGPTALSMLMRGAGHRTTCAILSNAFTLDLEGSTSVAQAAKQWRFADPCAGKSAEDVQEDVPLFIVRAGRDQYGVNDGIDRFVSAALRRNLPLTLVNHPESPHAFDLFHDSETSRDIIRQMLAFLRFHLLGPVKSG
jgi:hypothetical protein